MHFSVGLGCFEVGQSILEGDLRARFSLASDIASESVINDLYAHRTKWHFPAGSSFEVLWYNASTHGPMPSMYLNIIFFISVLLTAGS